MSDATTPRCGLGVLGVGVRPSIALAEQAPAIDRGITVDEYLKQAHPACLPPATWRAGLIHTGDNIRIEYWVVAERRAKWRPGTSPRPARALMRAVLLSQHYDVAINYVGHAEKWDAIEIDGTLAARDCTVTYKRGDRALAVATISRDLQSLRAELAMESTEP